MNACEVSEFAGLGADTKLLDPVGRRDFCSFCDSTWLSAWDRNPSMFVLH